MKEKFIPYFIPSFIFYSANHEHHIINIKIIIKLECFGYFSAFHERHVNNKTMNPVVRDGNSGLSKAEKKGL